MTKVKELLSLFDLRATEAELYQTLFYGGMMSASQLAKQANVSRTSVYDLLERLQRVGLVIESMKGGIKVFVVQSPAKVQLLLKEKEAKILASKKALVELEREYLNKRETVTPRLRLFEGQTELQQMMKDMLLYKDMTVYASWPIKKMVSLLAPTFLTKFHEERVARNIRIRVIWPKSQIPSLKKHPYLAANSEHKREVRIAPSTMSFSLGYAIYGNTVRFISSRQENFGFLVESDELAAMMTSQFQAIWKISKVLK